MSTTDDNDSKVVTVPTGLAHQSSPQPFVFYEAVYLVEAMTLKAATLSQLLTTVTLASELSIFYTLRGLK